MGCQDDWDSDSPTDASSSRHTARRGGGQQLMTDSMGGDRSLWLAGDRAAQRPGEAAAQWRHDSASTGHHQMTR